jgi:hypothetical protein
MKSFARHSFRLAAGLWLVQLVAALAAPGPAELSTSRQADASTANVTGSPVDLFREMLAAKPAERAAMLSIYPPERKERIEAKLEEYQLLPPELREQRLLVTELHWYLMPLMKTGATNRAAQLAAIPPTVRPLVKDRIEIWDILPPPMQTEVLEHETAMRFFVGKDSRTVQPALGEMPQNSRPELEVKLSRWQSLPASERQAMYARFQKFFELTEQEKQKTLEMLPEDERELTARAVDEFEKWPKTQRDEYVAAFQKFEQMTPVERAQFWKSAAQWQKLSPAEQQACRDLVKRLAQSPPLPPGFQPAGQKGAPRLPAPPRTGPNASPLN